MVEFSDVKEIVDSYAGKKLTEKRVTSMLKKLRKLFQGEDVKPGRTVTVAVPMQTNRGATTRARQVKPSKMGDPGGNVVISHPSADD